MFTPRDCYNQTVLFFLQLAGDFIPDGKKYTDFSKYIRMVLGWKLKYWVLKHIKDYDKAGKNYALYDSGYHERITLPPDIEPFSMNIKWILRGSKSPLFRDLRSYDRYLLYLYFGEGNTMQEIADIICKSKNTVNKDINRVLSICKKNITLEQ